MKNYLRSKRQALIDNRTAFAQESGIIMKQDSIRAYDTSYSRTFNGEVRLPKSWKGWSSLSKKHK